MKFVAIFFSAFLAGTVLADVYSEAIQQAHRAANATPGAGSPPPNSTPQSPPTDPALAATLQNISNLRDDLTAIANADAYDSSLKISLLNDLIKAAQGTKPATADAQKLAGHLANAGVGRKKLEAEKLARDLHALFNAAHLTDEREKSTLDEVSKILSDAGISSDDANNIFHDLQTISAATK